MVWAFFRCSAARDRRPRGRRASAAAACASAGAGRTAFFPQGIGDLLQDVARIHAAVQLVIARAVVCGHRHVENAFDKNTGLNGRTLLPPAFRMSAAGTAAAVFTAAAFPAAAGPAAAAFTAAALAAAALAAGAVSLASPEHKLTQTFRQRWKPTGVCFARLHHSMHLRARGCAAAAGRAPAASWGGAGRVVDSTEGLRYTKTLVRQKRSGGSKIGIAEKQARGQV